MALAGCALAALALTSCLTGTAPPRDHALVKDGKPASRIVLAKNAGVVERHAAEELAAFLKKSTGAELEVAGEPSKELYNIYLETAAARNAPRSAAIAAAVSRVKDDGFVLAADQDGVRVIGGKPVGVLYGAYEILKRQVGFRWFAPGAAAEYCPQARNVSIPEQITVSNPSFSIRLLALVCANWNSKTIDTWDWMLRNGMTVTLSRHLYYQGELGAEAQKRGAEVGRDGGHCFVNLLPDSLFAEHPEYFGLFDGKRMKQDLGDGRGARRQPCTSNPKVVEIMTESLKKILATAPAGQGIYLIGNNDADAWCQCPECVKLDPPDERQKKYVSTRYWTLVNKIAAEVLKTYPEVDLWAWGYQNYQYPPTGIVPDPRVKVEAAIHGRCYRHSMADLSCQANDKYRDILARWGKLKNSVCTLEYTDCNPNYLPIEKAFAEDVKYYKRIGLSGCALFTVPPDGVFGPSYKGTGVQDQMPSLWQKYYLAANLLWDVDADYDQLYEDMGSKYYGAAWPAMRQYRALLTKAFVETSGHICYGTPPYVVGNCLEKPGVEAELMRLLEEAEKQAGNDQAAVNRVKLDRRYFQTYWVPLHKEFLAKKQSELKANKATGPVAIDGKLDEADWGKADFTSGFILTDGKTLAGPQTFVKTLYDDNNLYFAVEALEPEPGKMKILAKERDGAVYGDSSLEFFIASPGMDAMIDTRGRYAHIVVNPAGVVYDSLALGGGNADTSYNSQAEIKTTVLKDRWVAEVRVPAAALLSKIQDGEAWKINVARNRKLVAGDAQNSSWSNGVFHGSEAFRTVALGGAPLLENGDFEDAAAPDKYQRQTEWNFVGDRVPQGWAFHAGNPGASTLVDSGAASGKQFLRIKDGSIYRMVNQPADFRGDLRVHAKARGKGVLTVHMYCYDRGSGKNIPGKVLGEVKLDTQEWTAIDAAHKCDDDKVLRLAFQARGEIDLDDVSVRKAASTTP